MSEKQPVVGWGKWLRGWLNGGPHFIIGDHYLLRWYVLPRNPWLNVYLHKFLHDDEDRALHDHPWWFISVMLRGEYHEVVGAPVEEHTISRRFPSVVFRKATHAHRVTLSTDMDGKPWPCWTLVITGRVVRDWGFLCPQGWRHWREFTSAEDYGQVGRGCD